MNLSEVSKLKYNKKNKKKELDKKKFKTNEERVN